MKADDDELRDGLPLPERLRAVAEELQERLGGQVPHEDEQRAGSALWAPFGFVPLLVSERGIRGLLAPRDGRALRAETMSVAWWDAARGQLTPLGGSLDGYLAVVRAGIRYDAALSEAAARRARELDRGSVQALLALAGRRLDGGELEAAHALLREAAAEASWWMAPCFVLTGLLRLQRRAAEAAAWCAEALARRWDSTGAGATGFVPRLSQEPRRVLRSAVSYLRRNESLVPGLAFDPAWRLVRDARDPLSPSAHAAAALELARTGRLGEAAARWEWLVLAHGSHEAAWRAESAYAALGWPLHRSHSRLLRLAAGR
jgi:hypothetical protein